MSGDADQSARDGQRSGEVAAPVSRRPRGRRIGALVALALGAVAVAFSLDATRAGGGPLVATWRPRPIDWLFLVSLALCGGVVAPIARDPIVREGVARRLRARPLALASAAWLVAVLVVGTVWPFAVGQPEKHLAYAYQPPVGFSVWESIAADCYGAVSGGRCRGSLRFPLGTNRYGESVLVLVAAGMRVAAILAVVTTAIMVPLATAVGTVAGYVGGWVDTVLMRYVDVQRAVPAFLVYVVLVLVVRPSLTVLVLVFGLLNWGGMAQIVRAETRTVREAEFVQAAETAGASRPAVLRNHVFPNVAGPVVVAATRQIPAFILVEAAIAYLRLNDVAIRSWGEIVAGGLRSYFPHTWWVVAWPALALVATVVAFSVFGDALRDVFDPESG